MTNLFALLVASSSAQGQDALSDIELFAAYCLGSYNRSLEVAQDRKRSLPPCANVRKNSSSCREVEDGWRKTIEEMLAQQARLKRYLDVRGISTARISLSIVAGYAAANQQGAADTDGCIQRGPEECKGVADSVGAFDTCTRIGLNVSKSTGAATWREYPSSGTSKHQSRRAWRTATAPRRAIRTPST